MKRIESLELTNIHDNRSETNKGNSGAKNDANFSCNNDSMADYFNHRFMRMHQKLARLLPLLLGDLVFHRTTVALPHRLHCP
jgi:hypothetical protein